MRRIIEDLVAYVEEGGAGSPALLRAEQSVGKKDLRLVAINILGWLKSRARTGAKRPMKVNEANDWYPSLQTVAEVPDLAGLFELRPPSLDFRADVPLPERLEIETYVDTAYRPRLWT